MPYKITLLKENTSKGHGCPDQIVSGTALIEEGNLKANMVIVTHIWVTEGRSFEVSYVSPE